MVGLYWCGVFSWLLGDYFGARETAQRGGAGKADQHGNQRLFSVGSQGAGDGGIPSFTSPGDAVGAYQGITQALQCGSAQWARCFFGSYEWSPLPAQAGFHLAKRKSSQN